MEKNIELRQWLEEMGLGQYAEAFENNDIDRELLLELMDEDLQQLGVASLGHRKRILEGVASLRRAVSTVQMAGDPGALRERVLQRFPFPVAYGYARIDAPESASHAVECVFYTYTALLRLTALIFLGQFLSSPGQNPGAAKALQRLRAPTLESWFSALITFGKRLFPLLPGQQLRFLPFAEGGPFAPGLAVAARQLSRLKLGDVLVHERLRNLRNERAHGTPWDEAECTRRLPELRALLEEALQLFDSLAEITLVRRSSGGMVRLVGAAEPFAEEDISEPRMEDLFEESETLLLNNAGEFLPLYPLFLASDEPVRQGYTEPLLSFDGHGQKAAMYLGVRSWTERQDTLARYLDLLRSKDIDPRFTKASLAPWSVAEWAQETSRGVIENLTAVKYFPDIYQERRSAADPQPIVDDMDARETADVVPGVDDAVRWWLDRGRESCLIVAAEAGAGKTSLFCHLAETVLCATSRQDGAQDEECPDCVLLLLGGGVRSRTTLFERIRDGLGFSDDLSRGGIGRFDELLTAWQAVGEKEDLEHDKRRILIFIDALNEAEDPKALFEELSELGATASAANHRAGRTFVRLLVSVRAERIETLLSRWGETSDTPFLQHTQNFAYFPDSSGQQAPYLSLRRFTLVEAATAYAAAQHSLTRYCPVAWERLSPATLDLLRHPLMGYLFHTAYAGVEQPPALGGADILWGAWLARTFDPKEGGTRLETVALDLADACIDGGYDAIDAELVSAWRERWQVEQGNDPIRIAAGLDPLERLTEAGFLRHTEEDGLDWISDSLAEQVLFRALHRRDRILSEESLTAWLALPSSCRLEGVLSRVAAEVWRAGRPLGLLPLFDHSYDRAWLLLGKSLFNFAATGESARHFGCQLNELVAHVLDEGSVGKVDLLYNVLVNGNWTGTNIFSREVHSSAMTIAEFLVQHEPDNTAYLSDLSFSYSWLGDMDRENDPAAARAWYEKALAISERLVEQAPDNTRYLSNLSFSYYWLGSMEEAKGDSAAARAWYEKSLAIHECLVQQAPDNTGYLDALSIAYNKLGDMDKGNDPVAARSWYEKVLATRERLVEQAPDNTAYLNNLSIAYDRLGDTDKGNDPVAARSWYEKVLATRERLVQQAPDK